MRTQNKKVEFINMRWCCALIFLYSLVEFVVGRQVVGFRSE